MTLIADGLLDSLETGGRANKSAMKTTVIAFDDAIADMTTIEKTAVEWAADETTILAVNQIGLETDTAKFKFGDGESTFDNLVYSSGDGDSEAVTAVAEWPIAPPPIVEGVMTITNAYLVAALSATDNEVTLENRVIPLLNETDPSVGFELRLAFGSTAGGEVASFRVMEAQTGAVTIVSEDDGADPAGEVDGEAEISPPNRGVFSVFRLAGSTRHYETTINDSPVFRGTATFDAAIHEKVAAESWTGAATLDLSAGQHQVKTLTGNVTGVTLSNRPPDGYSQTIQLTLIQDGTGSRTVVWPTGYKTPGGAAVTPTAAAGAKSRFVIEVTGSAGDIIVSSAGADIKAPA